MHAYASLASPGDCKAPDFERRYPYQQILADLRFRTDSGKLHCCVRKVAECTAHEDREVCRSARIGQSPSPLRLGGDGDNSDLEFGHAALVLSGSNSAVPRCSPGMIVARF